MHYYSSVTIPGELGASINAGATVFQVVNASGWPSAFPFTAVIDPDTPLEEIVTVTAVSGDTWTVERGEDGSVALPHDVGATVRHMITGRDLQWSRDHEDASANVHGVGSATVVGTSTPQTLTNKVIDGNSNTVQNISRSSVTGLNGQLSSLGSQISSVENRMETLEDYSPPLIIKVGVGGDGQLSIGGEGQGVTYNYEQVDGPWALSGGNTNQFEIPETGFYQISAQMAYAVPDNTTGSISFRLRTGVVAGNQGSGAVAKNASVNLDNQGGGGQLTIVTARRLVAGASCHFSVANGTNKTVTIQGSPTRTYFSLVRVA